MNKARVIALATIGLVLTHYVAYWYGAQKPAQIETVEKEVVRTDVITRIKEVVRSDGTKQIDTVVVDKSKTNSTSTAKVSEIRPPDWLIGASYNLNNTYSADISRRVLGPIFANVGATTSGVLSLGVKVEF